MSRVGAQMPEFVLASSSPRRLDLLRTVGIDPIVRPSAVDERPRPDETPTEMVERLALAKARVVAAELPPGGAPRLVVGADTTIDLDGRSLGKPVDRAEAEAMLLALRGRRHGVVTGVAVVADPAPDGAQSSAAERPAQVEQVLSARTEVEMRPFDVDELAWYLDSGEYRGKAGAYAIQGLGSLLVTGVTGSYQNVVGLPLTVLDALTSRVGHPLRHWSAAGAPALDGEPSRS